MQSRMQRYTFFARYATAFPFVALQIASRRRNWFERSTSKYAFLFLTISGIMAFQNMACNIGLVMYSRRLIKEVKLFEDSEIGRTAKELF